MADGVLVQGPCSMECMEASSAAVVPELQLARDSVLPESCSFSDPPI